MMPDSKYLTRELWFLCQLHRRARVLFHWIRLLLGFTGTVVSPALESTIIECAFVRIPLRNVEHMLRGRLV